MDKSCIFSLLCELMTEERAALLCERLYHAFGTTERIMRASGEDLMTVDGVDAKLAAYFQLVCALASRRRCEDFRMGESFSESALVRYLSGAFLGMAVETVYIFSLDANNIVVGIDVLSRGSVNTSHITIRLALETALRRGASEVIIAHNHPGGVSRPSMDDLRTTNALSAAFRSVGIRMRSHYIVAGDSFERITESEIPPSYQM